MTVYIFSDTKGIEKNFESLKKSKKSELNILPVSEIKKSLKSIPRGALVYLDIAKINSSDIKKNLNILKKQSSLHYGIIDTKGSVEDIADLFHDGASDYIGSKLLKKGIQAKRIQKVLSLKTIEPPDDKPARQKIKYIPSKSWKEVEAGKEYTFCFMLVELDNKNELKKLSSNLFSSIANTFHDYLEDTVTPLGGKIWIWMDFGGLILFPFDGKKCESIEAAFKLMLARKLISAEYIHLDLELTYRVAMHIGNTAYKKRGSTGNIVSDSINSVFHLGQKYTEQGGFYLTDEVFSFTPEGLIDHFVPAGEYEGRNILRMKRIL